MNKQGEFTMNKTVKKSRFSQKTEKRILIFTFTIIPVFLLLSFSEDVPVQFDRVEWLFPRQ